MPFFLYQSGNWYRRLIENEEIFSFLIWMHVGMVLSIYVLFVAQIITALKIIGHQSEIRKLHRLQGKAMIYVKVLVVLTGAILVE